MNYMTILSAKSSLKDMPRLDIIKLQKNPYISSGSKPQSPSLTPAPIPGGLNPLILLTRGSQQALRPKDHPPSTSAPGESSRVRPLRPPPPQRSHRPCPASSRCWAAQGAVRGRHLPPACPVGAAPRRPWSGGLGSAAEGGGSALRLHHRREADSGTAQAPELLQAEDAAREKGCPGAQTARSLQIHRSPPAAATGTGT